MTERIAILGGGVTGLVAANRLAGPEVEVHLFEAGPRLGGNQKSVEIGPYSYDIGTFIFPSFSPFFEEFPEVWPLYHPIDYAPLRITPKGNVHRYPFDMRGYLAEQGALGGALSVAGLFWGKVSNLRCRNVADYARYYVGDRVYRESGLQTYIERLFGLPDIEIDAVFAGKRMTEIANVGSFRNILRHKVLNRSRGAPFQWAVRPRTGFDTVFERIGEGLRAKGVHIHLDTPVERIERAGDGFALRVSGQETPHDRVLSSIPLPVLSDMLGLEPCAVFPTARLHSLFYSHRGDPGFGSGTLYNFSPNGLWKRLTLLSHYYGCAGDRHFFSVEVTRNPGDPEEIEVLRDDFERHIRSVGLMQGDLSFEGVERTNSAYPLYRDGARAGIEAAKARIEKSGVEIVGRQGQFDYIPSAALATQKASDYLETGAWAN